jgi:predicted Zn finger-like uncharacterized protein
MSLVTRCPRCKTLFRVLPAQLQARAGQVRCGRCMHVFDGFQALSTEQPEAAGETAGVEAGPGASAAAAPAVHPAVAPAPPASPTRPVPTPASPEIEASAEVNTAPPPPVVNAEPPVRAAGERLRDLAETRVFAPVRRNLFRKPSPNAARVAVCVLLVLVLASQAAFVFRSQLAARYPVMRTVLSGVCGLAGCSVPLPQRPDLVKIEASDVHMIDANRPALIQLTATLRSYANYDLAYPALDLVLTNANEHALARRIFVPEEYLDQTRDPHAGIAPRAEITVALDLDTGDLNAAGFRLDLIAAPAP